MLNSAPNEWTLETISKHIDQRGGGVSAEVAPGRWEPARPFGFFSIQSRVRLAWDVFTGQADALYWPNQPPPKAY